MKLKTLVIAAALSVASQASAMDLLGYAPNKSGGHIMIYKASCTEKTLKGAIVLSTTNGGRVVRHGCAIPMNDLQMMVKWVEDDDVSVFLFNDFEWSPTTKSRR